LSDGEGSRIHTGGGGIRHWKKKGPVFSKKGKIGPQNTKNGNRFQGGDPQKGGGQLSEGDVSDNRRRRNLLLLGKGRPGPQEKTRNPSQAGGGGSPWVNRKKIPKTRKKKKKKKLVKGKESNPAGEIEQKELGEGRETGKKKEGSAPEGKNLDPKPKKTTQKTKTSTGKKWEKKKALLLERKKNLPKRGGFWTQRMRQFTLPELPYHQQDQTEKLVGGKKRKGNAGIRKKKKRGKEKGEIAIRIK